MSKQTVLDAVLENYARDNGNGEVSKAARAQLAALRAITKHGTCSDCGYPLDQTEAGDIICHKCSNQIGDMLIDQLKQRFAQIHTLLAHGRTVGGNRQQAYSDAEDIANRVVHPEQYQTCNWDNSSSPDFDGCNGCPRTCATEYVTDKDQEIAEMRSELQMSLTLDDPRVTIVDEARKLVKQYRELDDYLERTQMHDNYTDRSRARNEQGGIFIKLLALFS